MQLTHSRLSLPCPYHLSANPVPLSHGLALSAEREKVDSPTGTTPLYSPNWSPRLPRFFSGFVLHSKPPCYAPRSSAQLGEPSDRFQSLLCSCHPAFSRLQRFPARPFAKVKTRTQSPKMNSVSPALANPRKWSDQYQESHFHASLSFLYFFSSLTVLSVTNPLVISCNIQYTFFPSSFQSLIPISFPTTR